MSLYSFGRNAWSLGNVVSQRAVSVDVRGKVFRMKSTGSYRVARLTLDKHWISFKLLELKNLLTYVT